MNFANSPHLLGPLAAFVIGVKARIAALIGSMLAVFGMATGPNNSITLEQRIENLEQAVFGGPYVMPSGIPIYLLGSADALGTAGIYFCNSQGVDAMTIPLPVAGTDDLKRVTVYSSTAHQHTITTSANGFIGGSTAGDTLTFGTSAGANVALIAYGGKWIIEHVENVTLSEV